MSGRYFLIYAADFDGTYVYLFNLFAKDPRAAKEKANDKIKRQYAVNNVYNLARTKVI